MALWPGLQQLNPERWLRNFAEADQPLALHLLNSFVHLAEPVTMQLFKAAFHSISSRFYRPGGNFVPMRNAWRNFRNTVVVTHVTGETPSSADSGHMFVRHARDFLGIDQEQIIELPELLQRLGGGATFPLLIVDDFSGSGEQFMKWWGRPLAGLPTARNSLAKVAKGRNLQVYFCVAAATAYARDRLLERCPEVALVAGNLLPFENSILHPESNVWPKGLHKAGVDMVQRYSLQYKIPDTNGGDSDWRGFHKLGLCFTFSHATPDATIPLFTWAQNGWQPLFRRG